MPLLSKAASSQSFTDLGIPNESQFRAVGIRLHEASAASFSDILTKENIKLRLVQASKPIMVKACDFGSEAGDLFLGGFLTKCGVYVRFPMQSITRGCMVFLASPLPGR